MTDTPTTEQETIASKIAKLLAKAESTTPEEAEALTAKATELMIRWSIDEAMIAAKRGLAAPDKIVERVIEVGGIYWQAHLDLGLKIGRAFSFQLLQRKRSGTPGMKGRFTWIGFESDITKAELLYTSLLIQATTGLREFSARWKAGHPHFGSMEGFKARRSFIFGFAEAIYDRLVQQFRVEVAKAARAETGGERGAQPSVELVLVDRERRVREYYDEKYSHLKTARGSYLSTGVGGLVAGRQAGMAANLGGTGISGSKGSIGRG